MTLELSKVPLIPPDPTTLPVGGRLGYFHLNWKFLGAHPSVIKTLELGLQLPVGSVRIPLSRVPLINSQYSSLEKNLVLCQAVVDMLLKGAIQEVRDSTSLAFYSRLFLVAKKTGGWRPVIDLSYLNLYLDFPTFKMETTQSIRNSLQVGQWTTSLDLKDAYFHVPMAPTVHKLLRFQVLGKVYQFVAMPFGLATAPREFTTLVKEVKRMALRLGISVHMYLDDWLIKANSCQEAQSATLTLLELTHKLGWIVNREKSDLLPKQVFTFLGQVFDLSKGVCYPTEARFLSIQEAIHPLLFNPHTTPCQAMHLLGLLASTEKLVPQGRLHMRHLQFHLRRNYNCHLKGTLDSPFTLDPSMKVHLRWWLLRNNVMAQAPLHPPKYVTSIYTDASAQGWGAHCAHMIAQGHWSTQQSKLHINILELKAVLLALKIFVPQLSLHQRIIQVASDNTTVCAYINKLGGTRSWDMFALTWHLFAFCRKNKVVLTARHVPGVMNLVADQLSRSQQTLHTEWSLNPKIFSWLSQIDFQPQIDLFATRFNHKLPQYVSPVPDPKALAVDALEMNWSGLHLYSFPPTALCPLVVKKLINSQSCRMLLVAPLWETKEWLQDLLALSIRKPIVLPLKENLLKQPHLEVFHQNLRSLNLHAFWLKSP